MDRQNRRRNFDYCETSITANADIDAVADEETPVGIDNDLGTT